MVRLLLVVSVVSSVLAMAQVLAPETPAEVATRFVKLMVAGKPTDANLLFSEKIQAMGAGPQIQAAWAEATGSLGPFKKLSEVKRNPIGSGPNDRDETIGANKPFRDLAEGLASRGIVVFRYDKRTFAHAARMANATIATEVLEDAVAAIALLRKRTDVDPKRVVVVGHSLGALLAPEIARLSKANGAVVLAPPARTPWQILPQQYRYLGVPEAQVAEIEKKLFAIRDGKSEEATLGASAAYWRDWASRDGISVAKALSVPMLVMRGDRDYQVIAEVPGANHLFIVGAGKPGPAEYEVAGHVDANVVNAIASFVSAL